MNLEDDAYEDVCCCPARVQDIMRLNLTAIEGFVASNQERFRHIGKIPLNYVVFTKCLPMLSQQLRGPYQ
jgi:hypothetical protein